MKYVFFAITFLVSCVSLFSCSALDVIGATRDAVEGATQITQDALRAPEDVVQSAANVTQGALETTGNVAEDLLVPRNRRVVIANEEMNEQELPYMPERDEAYYTSEME